MAKIIKANGKEEAVTPKNGSDFSLREMQKIVGGFIEIVRLRDNRVMVVNEEGWLFKLPYNPAASELYGRPIAGDALVCDRNQIK